MPSTVDSYFTSDVDQYFGGDSLERGFSREPGDSPSSPINEQHPEISPFARAVGMNLSGQTPEPWKRKLVEDGFEVEGEGFDFAVRRPGGKWYRSERSGGWPELADITDVAGGAATLAGGVMGAGAAASAAVPSGPGAVAAGVAGFAGGSGATELGLMGAGKVLGLKPRVSEVARSAATEAIIGGTAELGGRLIGLGLQKATKAIRAAYEGAETFTREEIRALAKSVPKADLTRYAGELGVRDTVGKSVDEIAESIYRLQPGSKALDARNAQQAGAWIDKTNPGRFGHTSHMRANPEYFTAETVKATGQPRNYRAMYGQPPQMSFDDWMRVPREDLEAFASRAGKKELLGASKAELAEFATKAQPAGTGKVVPREATRARNLQEKTRTVYDKSQPPFADSRQGWRDIPLERVKRLESERLGELSFMEPVRGSRLMRAARGIRSPLGRARGGVPGLGRGLEKVGRLGHAPLRAVGSAIERLPLVGWQARGLGRISGSPLGATAALAGPYTSLRVAGGLAVAGHVVERIGRLLQGSAPPAVKAMAARAARAMEAGREEELRTLLFLLAHAPGGDIEGSSQGR